MLMEVQVGSWFEEREAVKEAVGHFICKGMYVLNNDGRMGTVSEVINDGDDEGRIKVIVDFDNCNYLKKTYITDFEPARNWHRALFDG